MENMKRGYSLELLYNYKIGIKFEDPDLENVLDTKLLLGVKRLL